MGNIGFQHLKDVNLPRRTEVPDMKAQHKTRRSTLSNLLLLQGKLAFQVVNDMPRKRRILSGFTEVV